MTTSESGGTHEHTNTRTMSDERVWRAKFSSCSSEKELCNTQETTLHKRRLMLYNLPCWTSSSVIAAEWRLWYKQLKTHSQELNRFWLNYSVSGEQFQLTTTWILQTRYIFNDQSYINSRYLHFLLKNMNIIFKAKQKRAPTALTVDCSVCGAPAPDHIHFGGWFSITSYQRIKERIFLENSNHI